MRRWAKAAREKSRSGHGFCFAGLHGCASKCGLRVYEGCPCCKPTVVIATELMQNPGTSIANFAEELASLVLRHLRLHPLKLVWIEHYPERVYGRGIPPLLETFDRVTFTICGTRCVKPEWKPMSHMEVEQIIGAKLEG